MQDYPRPFLLIYYWIRQQYLVVVVLPRSPGRLLLPLLRRLYARARQIGAVQWLEFPHVHRQRERRLRSRLVPLLPAVSGAESGRAVVVGAVGQLAGVADEHLHGPAGAGLQDVGQPGVFLYRCSN